MDIELIKSKIIRAKLHTEDLLVLKLLTEIEVELEEESIQVEAKVKVNFASIKEIYEKNDIPMDADAIGLSPLYYTRTQLTKFIEELNLYFEEASKISA